MRDQSRQCVAGITILWVDIDRAEDENFTVLSRWLGHSSLEFSRNLENTSRPSIDNYGSYLVVKVLAIDSAYSVNPLTFLVGKNWIVTIHHGSSEALQNFDQQIHADSQLGRLSGAGFLAAV